jgi:hypothetical protein
MDAPLTTLVAVEREPLYTWLEQTYPHHSDPSDDEIHRVGEREEIGRWRDALLQDLAGRGTAEAGAVFDRLAHRFPELIWLKAMRVRAAETARRAEWVPPSAVAVLAKRRRTERGWITSDRALQTAVVDALDAYAERLGGRGPQAADGRFAAVSQRLFDARTSGSPGQDYAPPLDGRRRGESIDIPHQSNAQRS